MYVTLVKLLNKMLAAMLPPVLWGNVKYFFTNNILNINITIAIYLNFVLEHGYI